MLIGCAPLEEETHGKTPLHREGHWGHSGSPAREVTIASKSLDLPCKPAFDQGGDLWAGKYNGETVVEFTKAELSKSRSPAPRVTLSSQAIDGPGDVVFDPSGDLWVPNAGATAVIGFTESQQARSRSPAAAFKSLDRPRGSTGPGPSRPSNQPNQMSAAPSPLLAQTRHESNEGSERRASQKKDKERKK